MHYTEQRVTKKIFWGVISRDDSEFSEISTKMNVKVDEIISGM